MCLRTNIKTNIKLWFRVVLQTFRHVFHAVPSMPSLTVLWQWKIISTHWLSVVFLIKWTELTVRYVTRIHTLSGLLLNFDQAKDNYYDLVYWKEWWLCSWTGLFIKEMKCIQTLIHVTWFVSATSYAMRNYASTGWLTDRYVGPRRILNQVDWEHLSDVEISYSFTGSQT